MEFKVDVDRVVGTVPLAEADDDLSVRKLALERRRNSLKKGIASTSGKTKESADQRLAPVSSDPADKKECGRASEYERFSASQQVQRNERLELEPARTKSSRGALEENPG